MQQQMHMRWAATTQVRPACMLDKCQFSADLLICYRQVSQECYAASGGKASTWWKGDDRRQYTLSLSRSETSKLRPPNPAAMGFCHSTTSFSGAPR